jgi:surface carbohydrate biosynthesis protein
LEAFRIICFFQIKALSGDCGSGMLRQRMRLLIPIENQVRELDPKLLLGCIAAERGFSSVIGSRREMEFNIDLFPQSIYLSKSMTVRSLLFFRVARRFDIEIVAWDEEALVHLPPEIYFSRRLDPRAIKYVSHLFAWGEDNARLWRQYPHLPNGIPIHITGNPRSDMLRPELRRFYQNEIEEFQTRYGDFILVNTNFNQVNAFGPDMNLFKPTKNSGQKARFGRAARGMTREYAEGLRDHKQAVFEEFQRIIPKLEEAFPENTIVVRPHPTENHDVYRKIADQCQRVHVTNDGNVVPWLIAAKAVIHNGCTTGVEAYVTGTPAISYRSCINETYDNGFYRLPNQMSHQCFTFEELRELLQSVLRGETGTADGDDRQRLLDDNLTGKTGPLACERMVDVLDEISASITAGKKSISKRAQNWLLTQGLHLAKQIKSSLPGSHNRPEFQRHRYPGISLRAIQTKLEHFQQLLGFKKELKIAPISDVIFKISA